MSEANNKSQGGQTNSGSGRNIDTGGGTYIEGGTNISGGVSVFGGHTGPITYHDNRVSAGDEAKLKELFAALHQHVESLPATTPDEKEVKEEVKEAAEVLEGEVEAAKKNPEYKPKRVTMNGLVLAFKKVGGPVLSAALGIMGYPALGAGINQFAKELEAPKS
jgi:hypothetical protein